MFHYRTLSSGFVCVIFVLTGLAATLAVNMDKSKAICFTRRSTTSQPLSLEGTSIGFQQLVKYSTIRLDQRLDLNDQVIDTPQKATGVRAKLFPMLLLNDLLADRTKFII